MKLTVEITTPLPPAEAWRVLTSWSAHGDWVPFTRMIVRQGELGNPALGDVFVGRTGIGVFTFDDVMTVTRFEPPAPNGVCEVVKSGRLIKGKAWFTVGPGADGSKVVWVEEILLAKIIDVLLGGLLSVAGRSAFHYALRKALRPKG